MNRHPASRVRFAWQREGHRVLPVDIAVRVACKLMVDGDLVRARKLFEDVRISAPEHPSALTMLGSIAYQQGHEALGDAYVDQALACLSALLDRQSPPDDAGTVAPMVNLLLARGRRQEAEAMAGRLRLPFNPIRADHAGHDRRRRQARARHLPGILLVTLPKTASESLWNAVCAGLSLPQVHLALGLFPDCCVLPYRAHDFRQGGLCAKDHIMPSDHNLASLAEAGIDRIIVHLRDPRQIALSWAHFVHSDVAARMLAPIWRRIVPPQSVLQAGLAAVIDWSIDRFIPLAVEFTQDWLAVARDKRLKLLFTSFEDYAAAPEAVMAKILRHYGLTSADLDGAAAAGAEVVHWRRGEHDEWRRMFSRRQQRHAASLIPDTLAGEFGWHRRFGQ